MKSFDVEIGEGRLGNSWQGPFPKTTDCVHCGETARVACTVFEESQSPDAICDLHRNLYADKKDGNPVPDGEGFWLHDCAAFAIYLCPSCAEATCLYNQA